MFAVVSKPSAARPFASMLRALVVILACACVVLASGPLWAQAVTFQGPITTVVGNASDKSGCAGQTDSFGDGCPGTDVSLFEDQFGVATDSAGNLYIADDGDERIVKVSAATGILTTVAGATTITLCSGATDSYGDGCPATEATPGYPTGVAVDSVGNIYIATGAGCSECFGQWIRKVNAATGIITVVAGNGWYRGAGGEGPFCAGETDPLGDGCPATDVTLNGPFNVAVDSSGNIYIVDEGDQRIRKVSAATDIITTVAGSGNQLGEDSNSYACGYSGDGAAATSAELCQPMDVAVDGAGNLYIADAGNKVIRKVDAATGIITTVVDGSGSFIAVDGVGNLYFYGSNGSIDMMSAATGIITAVANPSAGGGIAVDGAGNIYVSDGAGALKVQTSSVDFGTVALGQTSSTLSFGFSFNGSETLGSPKA